ncbi:hypothetical protein HD806DRAFT_514303 [Xylariaceae sp. AK1471]|nr:hypothetical protein HD806DRAFT_514303 [Xylariaceae sp. AK1471]
MKSAIYISLLTALAAAAPLKIASNRAGAKVRDGLVPAGTDIKMLKVKRVGTVDARDGLVAAGVDQNMLKRKDYGDTGIDTDLF